MVHPMAMIMARAARWAVFAAQCGYAPACTWIVLAGQLDETPANRDMGLAVDIEQIRRSDEIWLVGGRISDGMRIEQAWARAFGVEVLDMHTLAEPSPLDSVFASEMRKRARRGSWR